MRPAKKNRKIEIQQITESRDTYGASIETWSKYIDAWANIAPTTGNESYIADSMRAEITTKMTINYISGISNAMRVRHKARYYDIKSIINTGERNRESILLVTEDVN